MKQIKRILHLLPFVSDRRKKNSDLKRENSNLKKENSDLKKENSDLAKESFDLKKENSDLAKESFDLKQLSMFPPGHYYSSIVSPDDLANREQEIWQIAPDAPLEINMNTEQQLSLVQELARFYQSVPFKPRKQSEYRYGYENVSYSYSDGIILFSMIRRFRPARIIEVGSGFSSALILDTNQHFFDNSIDITFIEPYPGELQRQLREGDEKAVTIMPKKLQEIPVQTFQELEKNDILFIDSSHVLKTGSDLQYLFFKILPVLKLGVLIHFHDIFYPFEYPKKWVFEGRNWNEIYFLRGFLMYNEAFEIILFTHYLHTMHSEIFSGMPDTYKNKGGNLWLRKKS